MKQLLIVLSVIFIFGCENAMVNQHNSNPNFIFSDSVKFVFDDSSMWTHKDTMFWKHYGRIDTCFYDSTEVINDSNLILCSIKINQIKINKQ